MASDRGTLKPTEFHPAATNAAEYLVSLPMEDKFKWLESFSSCAIEGNRLAEVCAETLRRWLNGEAVSDRYLLGLCWTIRQMQNERCECRCVKNKGCCKNTGA